MHNCSRSLLAGSSFFVMTTGPILRHRRSGEARHQIAATCERAKRRRPVRQGSRAIKLLSDQANPNQSGLSPANWKRRISHPTLPPASNDCASGRKCFFAFMGVDAQTYHVVPGSTTRHSWPPDDNLSHLLSVLRPHCPTTSSIHTKK